MARPSHELARLEGFSDAVVAIAITLLVLPLVDIARESGHDPVWSILSNNSGAFIAFAISFVVIADLWMIHHRIFASIADCDRTLVRLTLLWLFTVVFLPFPTALVGGHETQSSECLYIATLLASSLCLRASALWAMRHPELRVDASRSRLRDSSWMTPLGMLIALALTAVFPSVGLWSLLLLVLVNPVDRALARRAKRTGPGHGKGPGAKSSSPSPNTEST
jgi:uncharacterized membrane protein